MFEVVYDFVGANFGNVVYHHEVVVRYTLSFKLDFVKAFFQRIRRFAASSDKTFFEFFEGRRIDEYRHAIGIRLFDVHRAHAVDVEQDVETLIALRFHFASESAVAVCESAGVFHKFVVVDALYKLVLGDEIVIHALFFAVLGFLEVQDTENLRFGIF